MTSFSKELVEVLVFISKKLLCPLPLHLTIFHSPRSVFFLLMHFRFWNILHGPWYFGFKHSTASLSCLVMKRDFWKIRELSSSSSPATNNSFVSDSSSMLLSSLKRPAGPSGKGIVWCSLSHGLSLDYDRNTNKFDYFDVIF